MLRRILATVGRAANRAGPKAISRRAELAAAIEALRVQTEQLIAIERLNSEQEKELARLKDCLDVGRISGHVKSAVGASSLERDPFPHVVVDSWLPADVYSTLVRAIPPPVFFTDRPPVSRPQLKVPFDFVPAYSRRVWKFVAFEIVGTALSEALQDKFRATLREYIKTLCPEYVNEPDLRLRASDGRIMLRRPGYRIEPHRDPKWGFITALIYLARAGDSETYGTQLYHVAGDTEAPDDKPLYLDPARCKLARSVPFRPNTLLAFLNSTGAHGASIPADAMPPTLERYLYQIRVGPDAEGIQRIMSLMPSERGALWSGKKLRKITGYN